MQGPPVQIHVDPNAKPVKLTKPAPVPLHLQDTVVVLEGIGGVEARHCHGRIGESTSGRDSYMDLQDGRYQEGRWLAKAHNRHLTYEQTLHSRIIFFKYAI
jgi:hypothetical protein